MTTGRLDNKVAIVTGGGSGIGRAIAGRFAAEGAGVAIWDVDEEGAQEVQQSIAQAGGQSKFYRCDVTDLGDVNKATAAVTDDFGGFDILVNNAGIAHVGNLQATSPDDFERIYKVNVLGVYHCLHSAIGPMIERGGGAILNMASVASKLGLADRFAYSMSKGAVWSMTMSVARDYLAEGVRCNCVCPGRVHTPFVDGFIKKNYPGQEDEIFRKLSEFQPIGRMGTPEEIASLALFLCSDEASFITGSSYDIDGGITHLR